MCNIQQILIPDAKLTKMLIMVKIIIFINLFSSFLRLFTTPSDMIIDLFATLFLFLAYNSVYYIYLAIYLIFSLFNAILLFISSATILEMVLQNTLGELKSKVPLILGISLYLLIFYISALVFTFPVYKEMKAQLMESFGGGGASSNANRDNADEERPQNTTESSSRGFQAFTGRGVAVGGGN